MPEIKHKLSQFDPVWSRVCEEAVAAIAVERDWPTAQWGRIRGSLLERA